MNGIVNLGASESVPRSRSAADGRFGASTRTEARSRRYDARRYIDQRHSGSAGVLRREASCIPRRERVSPRMTDAAVKSPL
jgi:hypothetical protein